MVFPILLYVWQRILSYKYKIDTADYFITASNLLLSALIENDMSFPFYPSVNYSEQKYGLL